MSSCEHAEFGKNILLSFLAFTHFPYKKYIVNKPNEAAVKQRPQHIGGECTYYR